MTEPTVSVLLVDDDAMVRGWVRACLEGSEFRLVGETRTAAEATQLLEARRPDLLLIDFRLADRPGTRLVRELRERGVRTPAVLMTANAERGFNEAVRESGAQGTVLKTGNIDELLAVLREVHAGGRAFDRRYPRRGARAGPLTPREREVIGLVAMGATNREIAQRLGIGEETVKTLLARTYLKLGVRGRAEAVAVSYHLGLVGDAPQLSE